MACAKMRKRPIDVAIKAKMPARKRPKWWKVKPFHSGFSLMICSSILLLHFVMIVVCARSPGVVGRAAGLRGGFVVWEVVAPAYDG